MGYLTISTNVRCYQTHHRWHFSFRKTEHWCTCIVHATQSNCCGAVDFLSLEPCPQHPRGLITRFRESYSNVSTVRVLSQKDWRNQAATSWIVAMHWLEYLSEKKRFSCFPVLPGSAEAQVISGDTVKRLFIAYFIGNISAKKISKCVHICQSYSKPKVGRFLRHSVFTTVAIAIFL